MKGYYDFKKRNEFNTNIQNHPELEEILENIEQRGNKVYIAQFSKNIPIAEILFNEKEQLDYEMRHYSRAKIIKTNVFLIDRLEYFYLFDDELFVVKGDMNINRGRITLFKVSTALTELSRGDEYKPYKSKEKNFEPFLRVKGTIRIEDIIEILKSLCGKSTYFNEGLLGDSIEKHLFYSNLLYNFYFKNKQNL